MTYQEAVSVFTPVSAKEAAQGIKEEEGYVLFIGRSTCPYCQRFAPKLSQVAREGGVTVHYLASDDAADQAGISELRQKYNVTTVPGLLVGDKGVARVVCDSSLAPDEISLFIG
ncbi:conjugal transfer protein TraF [Streptococcus sp. DD12]|uniref:conjugal transfer protein TraF n=1 Tax=Streptococcus sp. DD12 TaxID=1777880 RepID=UPI00079608C5|nr:conjugal transfer protein TraF [Streptococcus sp. DD12]KXT76896.1 putative transport accessory protein [Streptococcus sp. DD12]